jgi:HEPN domain-containing protein
MKKRRSVDAVIEEWRTLPLEKIRTSVLSSKAPREALTVAASVMRADVPALLAQELRENGRLRHHLPRLLRTLSPTILGLHPQLKKLADALETDAEARRFAFDYRATYGARGRPPNLRQRHALVQTGNFIEWIRAALEAGQKPPPEWPTRFQVPWKDEAAIISRARKARKAKDLPRAERTALTHERIQRRAVRVWLRATGRDYTQKDVTRLLERLKKALAFGRRSGWPIAARTK